ncbi:PHD-finger domain-containing protein [Colletotrichum graminicola]|nr:PHD-finger domain-containing protein [Colletotrichum graminicola]
MTEPPPKPMTPKKKSKVARYGSRSNKRRRVSAANGTDEDQSVDNPADDAVSAPEDNGLGGLRWECIAVSLEDVRGIIASFHKTKDDNEKVLRDQLQEHLLPILERQEESRKRKEQQRERELHNLAKMANAKRSSRIANRAEQQKQEEKALEEAKLLQAQRAAAKKEEQQRIKLEKERDTRLMSREKRLQDRESRRLQHERELSQLSEDNRSGSGRISERRLQAEIEKNKRALEELEDEEDDWMFDCICGVYGQIDDGTHSVACERCNVWQHSKCLGISENEAEKPEFHLICQSCKRREAEAAARPKTTIKLKVHRPTDALSSPSKQSLDESNTRLSSSGLAVEIPVIKPEAAQAFETGKPGIDQLQTVACSPTENRGTRLLKSKRGVSPCDGSPIAGSSGSLDKANGVQLAEALSPRPATPKGELDEDRDKSHRHSTGSSPSANDVSSKLPAHLSRVEKTPGPIDPTSPRHGNSSLMATPIISREHGIPGSAHSSFTLPAPEGGLSPTKHSPPMPRPQPPSVKTPVLPAVLPPVATLSPSPRQQILTPPIKPAEPARRPQPPKASPEAM